MPSLRSRWPRQQQQSNGLPSSNPGHARRAPSRDNFDIVLDGFEFYSQRLYVLFFHSSAGFICVGALCLLFFVFGVVYLYREDGQKAFKSRPLHVLISAPESNENLCKTLLTAAIVNFPMPVLLNWKQGERTKDNPEGGITHIAKISDTLDWFNGLNANRQNDMVLIVDGFDMWFQLRPTVLMDRYYSINKAANARLARKLGRAKKKEHIDQKIIFGALKRCMPNFADDMGCWPVPESPLPSDMYGKLTDTDQGHDRFSSMRQRYLSSGMIMGPIKDVRAVFERAWEKRNDPQQGPGGSDQFIFNTIFGEQEYQREVMREHYVTALDRFRAKIWSMFGVTTHPSTLPFARSQSISDTKMPQEPTDKYEFGIGLDYGSELVHSTAYSESDSRFVVLANMTGPLTDLRTFDCRPHVTEIASDIDKSSPPYHYAREVMGTPAAWERIPLFVNFCTGSRPVMIHHNGAPAAQERWWHRMWMQPDADKLLSAQQKHAAKLLENMHMVGHDAIQRAESLDSRLKRLPDDWNTGGAKLPDGTRLKFWDLCIEPGHEDALFGDPSHAKRPT